MERTNMERDLINALRAKGWRMAAAESCTGGRIAQRITAVPGASDVFSGSSALVGSSRNKSFGEWSIARAIISL